MAYLKKLLENTTYMCVQGTVDKKISDICYDSKKVVRGSAFVCLEGTYRDGHEYVQEAVKKGATVCFVHKSVMVPEYVTVIRVRDTRAALAQIAIEFYGHPASKLHIIGITGTKGKTSTAYMIYKILWQAGCKTGLIGTIGLQMEQQVETGFNTTPESLVIQRSLRQMVDAGYEYCVMEVSSQGLKMHRVDEITFDIGVFTNISPDHIGVGEHANFHEYLTCKGRIFEKSRCAIVNADDSYGVYLAKKASCPYRTYGIHHATHYVARNIAYIKNKKGLGMRYQIGDISRKPIEISMPGIFNVYNSLAALAVCDTIGVSRYDIEQGLCGISVKGRIEEVEVSEEYTVIIDYAHNALSLENLLKTLRYYQPARIVTLFGCGGNRSTLRRLQMGEVAGRLSDFTIITSDNPRFENPDKIVEDIIKGIRKTAGKYITIVDRREAITYALTNAKKGDIIVLAGKGHEEYQEIAGKYYPMNERHIINEITHVLKQGT